MPFRTESQIFKTKFFGWDDVLPVDFTRTAESITRRGADLKVSMTHLLLYFKHTFFILACLIRGKTSYTVNSEICLRIFFFQLLLFKGKNVKFYHYDFKKWCMQKPNHDLNSILTWSDRL